MGNYMDEFNEEYQEAINEAEEEQLNIETQEYFKQEMEDALNVEVPHEYETLPNSDITEQEILIWKRQFPKSKIFSITLMDEPFIIRTLNRVEYKSIVSRQDLNAITREEVFVKTCTLYPVMTAEIIGEGDAGIVGTLAQYIMKLSGFKEPEDVIRLA